MKLINRDVDYAARALIYMVNANRPMVTVASMKDDTGVSGPFLRKIMQKLHKAGLVQAVKGKGGGFALARRPESITLGQVAEVMQGPLKVQDCIFGTELCGRHEVCRLRRRLTSMEGMLRAEMDRVTLLDLV